MHSDPELDAVERIVIAIKTYRHQTAGYGDPITNESVNAYLKQTLSIQDWVMWRRVQVDQQTSVHAVRLAAA